MANIGTSRPNNRRTGTPYSIPQVIAYGATLPKINPNERCANFSTNAPGSAGKYGRVVVTYTK